MRAGHSRCPQSGIQNLAALRRFDLARTWLRWGLDRLRGEGNGVNGKQGVAERWVMLGIIPVIMMAVAARQLYLSKTDDLSTWKGGGMGMFAGAETTTRYTKIYLTFPDGSRQPLHAANRPTGGAQPDRSQLPERTQYADARQVHQGHHLVGQHHPRTAQRVRRGRAKSPRRHRPALRSLSGAPPDQLRSHRPSGGSRSNIGRRPTIPRRGRMSVLSRASSSSRNDVP